MADTPCEQKKRRAFGRTAVRVAVCAAAVACAGSFGGSAWMAGLVPSLSPFGALLSVAAGAGSLVLLGALAVAIACMFSPRLFCLWMCPVGTCRDALTYRMKKRIWVGRVPQVGLWLVFVGTGAALAGYPLFGWLDPLALFNATLGMVHRGFGAWNWLAAAGFPLVLVLALIAPGLWCGKLCPLGALQDLLRIPVRQRTIQPAARGQESAALSRRIFLGLGLGAGYRIVLPPGREAEPTVIRPPVTGKSARFTRLCVRCGACVRACPSGIIKFGGVGRGLASALAPEVSFENDYCPAACTACGQACPTGAIPKFKAEEKVAAPMGFAQVDRKTCLLSAGRECAACTTVCPYGALDLVWDRVEMVSHVTVKSEACTGCGYCEYVCVSTPRAIRVKACGERRRA